MRIGRNASDVQRKRKEVAELIFLALDWITNIQSKSLCSF